MTKIVLKEKGNWGEIVILDDIITNKFSSDVFIPVKHGNYYMFSLLSELIDKYHFPTESKTKSKFINYLKGYDSRLIENISYID